MLTAIDKLGRSLRAWETEVANGPFMCPGCKWPAILKKGHYVVAHFAHEPGADCAYAEYHANESELHLRAKKRFTKP